MNTYITRETVDSLLLEQEVWRHGCYLLVMDGRLKVKGWKGRKLSIPQSLYAALNEHRGPIIGERE